MPPLDPTYGQTSADLRPLEDQFARADREARELNEATDAIIAADRARRQRQTQYRDAAPRRAALKSMAMQSVGFRNHASFGARRAALHADPTYQALPPRLRAAWDGMLRQAHDEIDAGDAGTTWRAIEQLASEQADELAADWAAGEDPGDDPAALAAMVPRP